MIRPRWPQATVACHGWCYGHMKSQHVTTCHNTSQYVTMSQWRIDGCMMYSTQPRVYETKSAGNWKKMEKKNTLKDLAWLLLAVLEGFTACICLIVSLNMQQDKREASHYSLHGLRKAQWLPRRWNPFQQVFAFQHDLGCVSCDRAHNSCDSCVFMKSMSHMNPSHPYVTLAELERIPSPSHLDLRYAT